MAGRPFPVLPQGRAAVTPPAKVTWLTPYYELWYGYGTPAVARMAKALKPIEAAIGPDRTLAALSRYLREGRAVYGIEVFARAYRDWDRQPTGLSVQEQASAEAVQEWEAP